MASVSPNIEHRSITLNLSGTHAILPVAVCHCGWEMLVPRKQDLWTIKCPSCGDTMYFDNRPEVKDDET